MILAAVLAFAVCVVASKYRELAYGFCIVLSLIGMAAKVFISFRGSRRASLFSYLVAAILLNAWCVGYCAYNCDINLCGAIVLAWLLSSPILFGSWLAWATSAGSEAMPRKCRKVLGWTGRGIALGLAFAPLLTITTRWPLHLAFLASRSQFDREAVCLLSGRDWRGPKWLGFYRVTSATWDPSLGRLTLLIDSKKEPRRAFVRIESRMGPNRRASGSDDLGLYEHLGGEWWYRKGGDLLTLDERGEEREAKKGDKAKKGDITKDGGDPKKDRHFFD